MKQQAGFSILELMVAIAVTLIVVAATLGALTDALHANEGITLLADMTENLRAGMSYMTRDLVLAGEGIPTGGISIPFTGDVNTPPNNTSAAPFWPGPTVGTTFPITYQTIPGVTPGPFMGPGHATNPLIVSAQTDLVTIIYGDTSLPLQLNPINSAANPTCLGTIAADGSSITFDGNCANLGVGGTAVLPGDLIMLSNAQGNVLQTVTNVNGLTLTFLPGDAFNLNGRQDAQGTIGQLQTPPCPPTPCSGVFPPTTATRIWMITYYLDDNVDPQRPQLMRRVNFRQPQPVGEVLEDLQVSYDVADGTPNPPASIKNPIWPDYPAQIRKVNLYLAGRSDAPYSQTKTYFRNNLLTQITLRSMAFVPRYN